MDHNHAVIIGVNVPPSHTQMPILNYAENDALELHAVLTAPKTGMFPRRNVDLLIGEQATISSIRRALRRKARDLQPDDFLLVYYSGHGFIPDWSRSSELLLTAYDTDADLLPEEPDGALRAGFLRNDVLQELRGSSLLILDSCFSSEIHPSEEIDMMPSLGSRANQAVLLGYEDSPAARESHATHHGVLTNDILEGLGGAAAGHTGYVTVEGLFAWLRRDDIQRSIRGSHNSRVKANLTRPATPYQRLSGPGRTSLAITDGIERIPGPLDSLEDGISNFVRRLLSRALELAASPDTRSRHRLDILRSALTANHAGIVNVNAENADAILFTDRENIDKHLDDIRLLGAYALRNKRTNLAYTKEASDGSMLYAVPIEFPDATTVSLFTAVEFDPQIIQIGEPIAVLITEFLTSKVLQVNSPDDVQNTELILLTSLKHVFGRIPYALYNQAYELYKREVESLVTEFELIVKLEHDGAFGGIRSFEALARKRKTSTSAPVHLLGMTQVWGDRFTILRDTVIAGTALRMYREYQARRRRDPHSLLEPVAINVAIASLLSPSYIQALESAIREYRLDSAVVLEISEQDDIRRPPGTDNTLSRLAAFQQYLAQVSKRLSVQFAIDDFGVGHSSLDRLVSLQSTQIKIDRSILKHPSRLEELHLVNQIAAQALERGGADARSVVLEGLDERILSGKSPLALRDVYAQGIRYIQGYIVGTADEIDLRTKEEMSEKLRPYW